MHFVFSVLIILNLNPMDVDSQLGICTMWTIADTVCPSNYRKMNHFFLSCDTLQADQQADLAFCTATRSLGLHERCNQKYGHRWKQEHDFPFWQQHCFRSASAGSSILPLSSDSWFLIWLKLVQKVSLISVQPEFVSDRNTINMGKKTLPDSLNAQNTMSVLTYHSDAKTGH